MAVEIERSVETEMEKAVTMEVRDLGIYLKSEGVMVPAVENLSFSLEKGETLGIIGESGSGKSLTCSALLGLLPKNRWEMQGKILFNGSPLPFFDNRQMRDYRGRRIAMIMQNPASAFNPMITIGRHFHETVNRKGIKKQSKSQTEKQAAGVLARMRIRDPEAVLNAYGFQLSGGMLQRIMIALALITEPDLIVADEPTTALDLTVQHEIIKLLQEAQRSFGTSIVLVSHDLGVIAHMASRIAVMYAGSVLEQGMAADILKAPVHPYTKGLMKARPAFSKERLYTMEGQPPGLLERKEGCRFYDRCSRSQGICRGEAPALCQIESTHYARCQEFSQERQWISAGEGRSHGVAQVR